MKNWITLGPAIGIVLVLAMNPAAADQHGRRQPWGQPGYYHPPERFRHFRRPRPMAGYYGQYGQNGYYAQPPVVYGPPQPPPGISFYLGVP